MPTPDAPSPTPRPRSERGHLRRRPRAFGRSRLGAPLEVFEAERKGDGWLVVAGTHGEEGEGVALLSAALRSVPDGALAADVVLALNPDGLARGTRGNASGVDLNRNFPSPTWSGRAATHRWTLDGPRDVRISPGEAPASEPETRAFLALIARRRPSGIVSVHAPLALVDDPGGTPRGAWLARRLGLPRVREVGYPTPGSLGTWALDRGLPIVTVELPDMPREGIVRAYEGVFFDLLVDADARGK